jgi:hypothetical protein
MATVIPPLGATPAAVQKVRVKAKAFGTFAGRSGEIIHFNPDSDDERYHTPIINKVDLAAALERGLVEEGSDEEVDPKKQAEFVDLTKAIGNVAAQRTAEHAEMDAGIGDGPSTLDSRQSTAWPDADRVLGGAEGRVDGTGIVTGDVDAPPAGGFQGGDTPPDSTAAGTDAQANAGDGASGTQEPAGDDGGDAPAAKPKPAKPAK